MPDHPSFECLSLKLTSNFMITMASLDRVDIFDNDIFLAFSNK